ncbi:MAG: hypothetical protein HUK03_07985 [Bacteroidaceae bacterium]|nr:hypothetical protein [Bacteroidaceae bacterium]
MERPLLHDYHNTTCHGGRNYVSHKGKRRVVSARTTCGTKANDVWHSNGQTFPSHRAPSKVKARNQ